MIEKNEEIIEKIEHYLLLKFSVHEKKDAKISISDFTKCYNGGAFKSKEYVQFSNKKLITIKNVDDNGFNTSSVDYLNENIDNKYLLKIGDIIMTMTGNVGRVGIVSENNCYLNQRVLKIESICQVYLYCYLKKHILDIISLGRGTAQKNLSLVDFQNMPVFNTKNEIKEFNNNVSFLKTIVKLKCKNIQLNKIKKQLLTKYFD